MDLRIPRIGHLRFWQRAKNSPRGAYVDLAESKGVFDTSVGGEPTSRVWPARCNVHLDKPEAPPLALLGTKICNHDDDVCRAKSVF